MGFLSSFFGFEPEVPLAETKASPRTLDEIRDDIRGNQAGSGTCVSLTNALRVSTVIACARVIAEGLAQVPCKVFQTLPDGSKIELPDHALYELLYRSPNDWQTAFEFREQIGLHLALTGNAFVYINRDSRGTVLELYAFDPQHVAVTQNADYSLSYRISTGKRKTIDYIDIPQGQVWHLRGPSWSGWEGLDAIAQAREAIGLGIAQERFGASVFRNGARPGGILTAEQRLTPDQASDLKRAWREFHQGPNNAGSVALLNSGLKYQPLDGTADKAEWTESRRYQVEEVCRFFRVNPVMVMHQVNSTSYASVEQLFLAHLTHTLMPWYERFEQSANKALLSAADRRAGIYVKLNANAMLRGSTTERTAYYGAGRSQGWLTINEIREKEDLPRSDDPLADQLTPAANLFGAADTPTDDEVPKNDN